MLKHLPGLPGTAVRLRCAAAILVILLPAVAAHALDFPRSPRLRPAADASVAGGFQVMAGDEGDFDLFTVDPSGAAQSLGRYNGRLAGITVAPDGRILALTRDGALGAYGDESETLAFPDSRWHMLDVTWWNGEPLAVTLDGTRLYAATPDSDGYWQREEYSIAQAGNVIQADLVPLEDELHLLWNARSSDLSGGALRHAVLRDGHWRELPPLPLGDVTSFTAFVRYGELRVAALATDLLVPDRVNFIHKAIGNGTWYDVADNPELADLFTDVYGLAASGDPGRVSWLATGPDGAFFHPAAPGGGAASPVQLAAGASLQTGWTFWVRLATLAGIIFLLAVYCRRSRALARLKPSQPPDLLSRAAALGVDWFLVSLGMAAYHIASGDIRILSDLLATGDVEELFWVNLAALALFMGVMEAIYGRTPGKYLAGMRVRSVLGGPPGFVQAMFRNLLRVVDMFPISIGFPGLIGAIATFFNPRRQRIGDILAATVVRRHLPLRERKFLLASASPRRLELLTALGLDVRAEPSEIDEDSITGKTPEETALLLAEAKARTASARDTACSVVVAADTVVVLDGKILGKPRDAEHATQMLSSLSGRSHSVFTGVTVWDGATGQALSGVEETEVEFRELSQREIETYVASGDPMDKAGAYGVQTGYMVKQVRGSLSNVAGLPMERLQTMLQMLDS